jgi:lipopolysaccharide export LptBFGC system permease protein LptF
MMKKFNLKCGGKQQCTFSLNDLGCSEEVVLHYNCVDENGNIVEETDGDMNISGNNEQAISKSTTEGQNSNVEEEQEMQEEDVQETKMETSVVNASPETPEEEIPEEEEEEISNVPLPSTSDSSRGFFSEYKWIIAIFCVVVVVLLIVYFVVLKSKNTDSMSSSASSLDSDVVSKALDLQSV